MWCVDAVDVVMIVVDCLFEWEVRVHVWTYLMNLFPLFWLMLVMMFGTHLIKWSVIVLWLCVCVCEAIWNSQSIWINIRILCDWPTTHRYTYPYRLGNNRGNGLSMRHIRYTPNDPEFWDFR
jgi:hypothetical protein